MPKSPKSHYDDGPTQVHRAVDGVGFAGFVVAVGSQHVGDPGQLGVLGVLAVQLGGQLLGLGPPTGLLQLLGVAVQVEYDSECPSVSR